MRALWRRRLPLSYGAIFFRRLIEPAARVVCGFQQKGVSPYRMPNESTSVESKSGPDKLLAESVVLTRLDKALGWARKYSLFPYPFATACCAMEYMSLSMSPYDIDRFGALLPRFSPRQADLLMVIGTVNHKLSPVLKRVYEQMSEPKWVMAFGACAASGGFYDNYATVQGIDRIIPVDVYVPGCPPRPEAVLDGLMELQGKIAHQKHPLL